MSKQLYRTSMSGEMYYCWSNTPAGALRYFRRQALKKFGKYTIKDLQIREKEYVWENIQLTRELLQSCGIQ